MIVNSTPQCKGPRRPLQKDALKSYPIKHLN